MLICRGNNQWEMLGRSPEYFNPTPLAPRPPKYIAPLAPWADERSESPIVAEHTRQSPEGL